MKRQTMESQRLLSTKEISETPDDESFEEWMEESSESSYYSDSDSTIPDWEPYIDDTSGELLYIDCHPFVTHNKEHLKTANKAEPFSKTQLRKSTRGKFLRLIRRRDSSRRSKKGPSLDVPGGELNTQKVKFQDFQEGEQKVVTLEVDSENRYNLCSDKSLAESLLGLIVSTLSDGNRVMIAGFSYDSKAKHERNIKIGDWLKSINNIDVNVQNLDDILQKFINHNEVLLTLQRVAATEVTKDPPINELSVESDFVREMLNKKDEEDDILSHKLYSAGICVLFLDADKCNETNDDVLYCYPKPLQKNILGNSRGMFITLSHLLQDLTQTQTRTSSLLFKDKLAHVVYTQLENRLMLYMLPDDLASVKEIVQINSELIRFLEFSFGRVERCFSEQHVKHLDWFFFRYFIRIINGSKWTTIKQFVEHTGSGDWEPEQSQCFFEEIMPVVPTISLHDDALMQIDDALAELEASDYREWNEEPLDCQRLFTILGSALFHSGYLLVSHLIYDDLVDVYNFCKQQGLLHLSRTEPVKSLVMWKEVYPRSCRNDTAQNKPVHVPDGKRYLLVVGSGKDILVSIMEAGGCTEPPEENMGPDAFYVEEAQATLAHVQELGLNVVAERCLVANGGYEIATPMPSLNKRKSDIRGALNFSKTSSPMALKESSPGAKKNEVTSILKRRSVEQHVSLEDVYDAYSEESSSQAYSETSDDSGSRRRPRYDSNDEESDLDEFGGSSQMSGSSFDISEVRQALLSDLGEYTPMQITSGTHNVLYHFVHLDTSEGTLITPADFCAPSQTYTLILNNFKKCCQNVHGIFQNTLRFKSMPTQDIAKSLMNKSLIAIKEHGMLFECPFMDDKDKKGKVPYWVVGRLFYMPHPKEVYLCYQDTVPQNVVELAFRINLLNKI